jgi:uracil phosphoribosyltransferase
VSVGYAGLARDETTAIPQRYYLKLPPLGGRFVLVLEPMLATGGSLSATLTQAKLAGAQNITALCVVVAPEGLRRIESEHPDVRIVAAALDRELDSAFYIRPGLGDMGDRLFGTVGLE